MQTIQRQYMYSFVFSKNRTHSLKRKCSFHKGGTIHFRMFEEAGAGSSSEYF